MYYVLLSRDDRMGKQNSMLRELHENCSIGLVATRLKIFETLLGHQLVETLLLCKGDGGRRRCIDASVAQSASAPAQGCVAARGHIRRAGDLFWMGFTKRLDRCRLSH